MFDRTEYNVLPSFLVGPKGALNRKVYRFRPVAGEKNIFGLLRINKTGKLFAGLVDGGPRLVRFLIQCGRGGEAFAEEWLHRFHHLR
jgi:hypothetical protein